MIEIRRVRNYDGGNHLTSDVLQFREKSNPPSPWTDVPVLIGFEAVAQDYREGLVTAPDAEPQRRVFLEAVEGVQTPK